MAARRDLADAALTDAVIESFAGAGDERFRTVITSLVRHLHAFASEVELTEDDGDGVDRVRPVLRGGLAGVPQRR